MMLLAFIIFVGFFGSIAYIQMRGKKMKTKEYRKILVTTTLDLNQEFETIGMVTATIKHPSTDFTPVTEEIKKQAFLKGADAVIGFKAERTKTNLTEQWSQSAYGTAVKYKKKENAGA